MVRSAACLESSASVLRVELGECSRNSDELRQSDGSDRATAQRLSCSLLRAEETRWTERSQLVVVGGGSGEVRPATKLKVLLVTNACTMCAIHTVRY